MSEREQRGKLRQFLGSRNVLSVCVAMFSIAAALPGAIWRPLSFSELMEFYIERLPSLSQVWHVLKTHPPTTEPPLGYAMIHASLRLFGSTAFSARIPAMLSVAVALCGLFVFLSRRMRIETALIAPLVLCASGSFFYAYEGRLYGMLLGAAAAVLLAWQSIGDPLKPKRWALAGVTLSLAFALLVHYYAVLLCLPIVAAEGVRAVRRKRIFWQPLVAMAVAYTACLAWIPFWRASMAFRAHIWFVADLNTALEGYNELISPAWTICALVLAVGLSLFRAKRDETETEERPSGFPSEELAALLALALLPIFGYGLAKFSGTGLFQTRYAAPAALGCAGLVSIACESIIPSTGRAFTIPLVLTLALFSIKLREARDFKQLLPQLTRRLENLDSLIPGTIVVSEPQPFLEYYFYASPHLRAKLAMPLDEREVLTFTHSDTMLLTYRPLREVAGLASSVPDLQPFLAGHPEFYVWEVPERTHTWLLPTLLNGGYRVTLKWESGAGQLYYVVKN